jgi:hypothetical protein
MLELVLALKLLTQLTPSADHVARVQQNAQLRTARVEPNASATSGTALSKREGQQLRAACERFVAAQPGKVIDLRRHQ